VCKKWFKILHSSNFLASNNNSKKQWVFKCAICYYQSTLVTVTFIGQMFYCSQSEISFHIITAESYFGVCIAHLVIHTIYIQSSLEFHRIYSVLAHLKTHCFLELLLDAKKLLECRILNHFLSPFISQYFFLWFFNSSIHHWFL
jgi:hypothetical protein